MRFTFALVALALASCSSEPAAPSDAAIDATTLDAAADTSAADAPDACWLAQMSGAPRPCTCADGRAGNLYGCDPPRCTCTGDADVDARADTAPDVAVVDAEPDASIDAPAEDVIDAGQVDSGVDAPHDAGAELVDVRPVDAGPTFPSLATMYGALEIRILFRATCAPGACGPVTGFDRSEVRTPADCFVDGSGVHFSLRACTPDDDMFCDTVTGLITTGADAGRGSVGLGTSSTINPRLESGAVYGASPQRRSFHVQFAIPSTPSERGATGIAGRTGSPDLGDVWLLGCPVR